LLGVLRLNNTIESCIEYTVTLIVCFKIIISLHKKLVYQNVLKVSARTMLKTGDLPYWNELAFVNAKVVKSSVVMLLTIYILFIG
jgi:hypothetical protein